MEFSQELQSILLYLVQVNYHFQTDIDCMLQG